MNRHPLHRIHRLSAYGAATAFAASGLVIALPAQSAPSERPSDPSAALSAKASSSAVTRTRTIARTTWKYDSTSGQFVAKDPDPNATPKTQTTFTVHADKTRDLRGRERISISWSGAVPSAGRAGNPYGENGLNQEYPVVVLQCRGTDDPSLPAPKRISPETCWTSTFYQRSMVKLDPASGDALWTKDPAPGADVSPQGGMADYPSADTCPDANNVDPTTGAVTYLTHLTPFVSATGKVYPACDATHMPPEAAAGSAFPPAEVAAFTSADGTGHVNFEVRSDVENESLGCNHTTACSIVVIPIMGQSCVVPSGSPDLTDSHCKLAGQRAPGSTNFTNEGVDLAVSPRLWWTPSNWANRVSLPITFGLPPDTCDLLDPRAPTGFYGSELLAQASLQWSPAYCLNKKRFKYQHNQMPDAAGFQLMQNGDAPAAEVSSLHDAGAGDPVAYAPTAITGFSVGYIIDKPIKDPDTGAPLEGGEYTNLRLTPRLLAKLLTESYTGTALGEGHPGMADNPRSINADPDFTRLNPGLSNTSIEAAATVLSLSESSDVIEQLTEYIANDKEAMDFVSGKPDPWGMRVNPSYKKLQLPTPEWPLLDTYVPPTPNDPCRNANPGVYLSLLAAPVTKLLTVAQALIDAWPNDQTRCDTDLATHTFKTGRVAERQNYGSRFMLGIVSLGDAARYGLRSAALETRSGTFVAPTLDTLGKAVGLMTQASPLEPFTLDQGDIAKSGAAYPGTMVVYTAARTQHLDQADADKVAQFIRISTTEGQQPGSGNGELPDGFLPIRDSGVTRKLYVAAQASAKAIEAQYVPPTQTPTPTPTASPTTPSGASTPDPVAPLPTDGPAGPVPSSAPSSSGPAPIADATAPVVATQAVTSPMGNWVLPILLCVGLLGGLIASCTRIALAVRR